MRKKLYALIYGVEHSLRERLFRLVLFLGTIVTVVAIAAGFILQNPMSNTLPLCLLLAVLLICAYLTFWRKQINIAVSFFATMIVCIIFPGVFFLSGGIDGGASVWFVLGIMYIFIMFQGKQQYAFLALAVIVDLGTYVMAYQHPEWIHSFSNRGEVYYDSLFAVLTVGIAVGLMVKFQITVYQAERAVTEAQKAEIEQISKTKDVFFTNMSHEIRTPINTIIGLNEMILREEISDEVAQDALNIKNASQMLLALVNDMLDYSQLENKRMEVVSVTYDTRKFFQELVDLMRNRIEEKGLKFYVNIDSRFPKELYGDEKRLKQIVVNILTNAAKYTKDGSISLNAQCELLDRETAYISIDVADTGIGIKKEDLENLYESFTRADQEQNHMIEGSGLGLAITKQLVNLLGGRITVDSIYTKGSTFTVILEQKVVDMDQIGEVDFLRTDKSRKRAFYERSFEAPEARVLIVDDNEANLMVATKLLRDTKVQIDTASSGPECLEYTKQKRFHVILLDSMMLGMDGLQTLKEIRRQENGLCRKVPVIALTANANLGDEQRYLEQGFDGYLAKPVESSKLEEEILKFLPDEIIEYQLDDSGRSLQNEEAKRILNRKRKKLLISTDSVSDLPADLIQEYEIKVMYQYVETARGIFRDTTEIDSDNLSRYLSVTHSEVRSQSASVEEYEAFYAQALTEAEEVLHISSASHISSGYERAVLAARGFGHVHVIDSGHISGGEGLLVLYAAQLARNRKSLDEICKRLEECILHIQDYYLLPAANIYYQNGHTNHFVMSLCNRFQLHPMLHMRQSMPRVSGFYFGKLFHARKRFIRNILSKRYLISPEIVYVTHVGCTVKEQREIVNEIMGCIPFERCILQKSSVSTSANAGYGTIGIAFFTNREQVLQDFN